MSIDRRGQWWKGTTADDIAEYLAEYTAEGYPATEFRTAACGCGSSTFNLDADDTEGAAKRTCVTCGKEHLIADSSEYWEEAEPERCVCTCGSETMNIGVGFAFYAEGDVRWLYIGCRCTACGILGCYADWKVAYSPSRHLLDLA